MGTCLKREAFFPVLPFRGIEGEERLLLSHRVRQLRLLSNLFSENQLAALTTRQFLSFYCPLLLVNKKLVCSVTED